MWWERALQSAEPSVFWLDRPDRPSPRPRLSGSARAELAVVGGGFSGLWTAILAKERKPEREVLLVEAERIGWAATGRNGGFCAASLTHGAENGRARFPAEFATLEKLGLENLDAIEATIARHGISCGFERTGELAVATESYQVAALAAHAGFLGRDEVRAEVTSPRFLAGAWDRNSVALVDPARLAWGLAEVAERAGVRIVENTAVSGLSAERGEVVLSCVAGEIKAHTVALCTNAFRSLVRRARPYVLPVYDYVLVTEPLTPGQLAAVGWKNRQGLSDVSNQFHYFRLTPDNRILWGGYDAIYHLGRRLHPSYDDRPATFALLARQFFDTFPQLEGVSFSHRWGGAIDTCTRFCPLFGTAAAGKVAYVLGYTGLGVGASRFGANVLLDLLSGEESERTSLEMVRRKPLPFPPEPFAYLGVQLTRRALAKADRNQGRRGLWLRSLDWLGVGFDS